MHTFAVGLLVFAFPVHVAMHVAVAVGLFARGERKRAVLAFLLPPLAPLYAYEAGMRRRFFAWSGSFLVYACALPLV